VLSFPFVRFDKALFPAAKLHPPVAEELKFVVEPIEIFEEMFPPPLLKNIPLIVPFEPDVEIEPVTVNPDPDITSEPVITADPENGNAGPPPPPFNAKEAVVANDEVVANEAVPKSEPVRDVAVKAPVIFTVFAAKSPFINGVPEPEAIYNLLLSSVNDEGPALYPIAMLFEELPEKLHPAYWPNAMLFDPDLLLYKADFPIAVL